uniref:Uncharacterized protein n=1 Tax=Musa acuminata subsp. malaccensis TaxID=214687 RepID=A0A804K642_MUSAM
MADGDTIGDDVNVVVKPSPMTIRFALIVTSPASMRSTSLTSSSPALRCSASASMLSGWRTSDRYRGESATHVIDGEDKATMTAMDEAEAPSKVELSLPRLCYQWRGRHPRLHICHLSWPPPYCPQIPPPIGADKDAKRRKGHSTRGGAGTDVRVTQAPTTSALSQDEEQHEMSGDEAGKTLLVEVGGIMRRVDLIIIKDDQTTALVSTPTTLSFTTKC